MALLQMQRIYIYALKRQEADSELYSGVVL